MTRGKQAAMSANRRDAAGDAARIEQLRLQVKNLTEDRDSYRDRYAELQRTTAAQLEALAADRDAAVSPALQRAEALVIELRAEVRAAEKETEDVRDKWARFLASTGMGVNQIVRIISGMNAEDLAVDVAGSKEEADRRWRIALSRGPGGMDTVYHK